MLGVFRKILDMSLTGSIVIAVVLLARVFLRRAPKIYSYLLWSVVLFRLLCPLSVSAQVSVLKPIPVQTSPGVSSVSYGFQQSIRGSSQAPAASPEVRVAPIAERKAPAPMELIAWVWLAGAAGMAVYSLGAYRKLKKRLSEAVPLEDNVYIADGISTPFVMGLVRPKIYLPVHTPEENQSFILAHEKHHIQRGDHVWKLLAYAALCLHWFNPLVWLSFCLAGKDMEMSCDEAVVKSLGEGIRADYAQALLRLSGLRKIGLPLAFGEGNTKGRILNLARWRRPRVWVSALCVLLCLAVLTACALNPKQEEKPLEELTRTQGPASVGVGELYFTLPEGCAIEARETDQTGVVSGTLYVITQDAKELGGVTVYTAPGEMTEDSMDWISEIPLPEWSDNTLGWFANNWGTAYSIEFFTDAPGEPVTPLQTQHNLYPLGGYVYDLWFDELTASQETMDSIADSASLGQGQPDAQTLATLPPAAEQTPEDAAFARARKVVNGVKDGAARIRTVWDYQNTPERNSTQDFCFHDEIGFLWLTQTADGQTKGALYLYGDEDNRYFEGQGKPMRWSETEIPQEISEPWLGRFNFSRQYATYQDTLTTDGGYTDLFRIDLPFADTPDAAPVYWANFDYDSDGAFVSVTLQVNPAMDNAVTITESIVTLDRETVAAEIQKAAEAAQK